MRLEVCGLLQAVTEPGGAGLAETFWKTSMRASPLPNSLRQRLGISIRLTDVMNGNGYAATNFARACKAIGEYLQH